MNTLLNIKNNPPPLLLLMSAILLFTLVFSKIFVIDFQGIKMFNFPLENLLWIILLFLISLWALYVLTSRFLYSVTFTRIHVFITVFISILFLIVLFVSINPAQELIENNEMIGISVQVLSLIFVFAQLIYLANLLLGLLTKRKTNQTNGVDF